MTPRTAMPAPTARTTATLSALALAAVLPLAGVKPASAGTAVSWSMDERSGSTMAAVGGHGPNGRVGSSVVMGTPGAVATSYAFPTPAQTGTARPDRLVTVPNSVGGRYLNPGTARITVAISVTTRGTGEYNLIQKGQARTRGGYYKIEVNSDGRRPGEPRCTFRSGSRSFTVTSTARVNDGRWHRIACTRAPATGGTVRVTLAVDGAVWNRTYSGSTGSISNTMPLSIGGKYACNGTSVECDYFEGALDQPSVTVG